ncbi:Outer membrane protein beta-barrel domain-containing protein [Chitinophaga sp. YR627]|uniref:porin family protein n=1 Tax=Chitinophaga sp. YR627 TaxID=1881041 RepID=UPI0008E35DB8|nr:porin family protein [Chitinophaga sp. YR627]SFO21613.1 Outer membrane protein beta-barrel domain-containing protein [Chitinophaga sp. YR627]
MRKILLLALFNLGFLYTHAQTSFGVTAGFGTSKIHIPDYDDFDSKFNPSWRAGVMADIKLIGKFYLQPQLLISTKGQHTYNEGAIGLDMMPTKIHAKTHLTYLELPVNVVFKLPLGSGKLITGAGGYIAYGLGGNYKVTGKVRSTGADYEQKGDVKFEKDPHPTEADLGHTTYYRPIDFGLNFLAGYEFKNGLGLNFTYSPGLKNMAPPPIVIGPSTIMYDKRTNVYAGLSVTYVLKKHTTKA